MFSVAQRQLFLRILPEKRVALHPNGVCFCSFLWFFLFPVLVHGAHSLGQAIHCMKCHKRVDVALQGIMFAVPGNRKPYSTNLNNERRVLAPETGKSRGGVSFRVGVIQVAQWCQQDLVSFLCLAQCLHCWRQRQGPLTVRPLASMMRHHSGEVREGGPPLPVTAHAT